MLFCFFLESVTEYFAANKCVSGPSNLSLKRGQDKVCPVRPPRHKYDVTSTNNNTWQRPSGQDGLRTLTFTTVVAYMRFCSTFTFGKLGPSAESYLKSLADVACSTGFLLIVVLGYVL